MDLRLFPFGPHIVCGGQGTCITWSKLYAVVSPAAIMAMSATLPTRNGTQGTEDALAPAVVRLGPDSV